MQINRSFFGDYDFVFLASHSLHKVHPPIF